MKRNINRGETRVRPTIICNLTPDAVALLQLIKSKSIDFQKIGSVDSPGHVVERAREYLEGEEEAFGAGTRAARPIVKALQAKRGSGRRTVNGVVYKTYRKHGHMNERTYLAEGHPIKPNGNNPKLRGSFDAIVNAMSDVALKGGKIRAIRRDEAIKIVKKQRPNLKGFGASAIVSKLHQLDALKVVL